MKLKGREIDPWGNVIFSTDGLVDHLLRGGDITGLTAEQNEAILQFNKLCKERDHPEDELRIYNEPDYTVEQQDQALQGSWFIPDPYNNLDVKTWLLERCQTDAEKTRIEQEWVLFEERDMEQVLRFLIYFVDNLRSRKVVWGVGRGSSIASYALYLIGVHRIDSIKYNLDPQEFLK
jgi:DNA polymerase III alpha subunit